MCGIVFLKLIMELDPVTLFAQFSEAVAPRCDLLSLCELSSLELSVDFSFSQRSPCFPGHYRGSLSASHLLSSDDATVVLSFCKLIGKPQAPELVVESILG